MRAARRAVIPSDGRPRASPIAPPRIVPTIRSNGDIALCIDDGQQGGTVRAVRQHARLRLRHEVVHSGSLGDAHLCTGGCGGSMIASSPQVRSNGYQTTRRLAPAVSMLITAIGSLISPTGCPLL